jgi:hypothetical protein
MAAKSTLLGNEMCRFSVERKGLLGKEWSASVE